MKSSKGKLQVIVGPMFSGKTSELIRRLMRYRFAGCNVCLVFNAKDAERNATHLALRNLPIILVTDCLMPQADRLTSFDVIGIDEGHVFLDLEEFAGGVSEAGKKVVVAALDGDSDRNGFMNVLNLIPLAESVIKLSAVCMSCANEAPYTKNVSQNSISLLQADDGVGGIEKYMAVCQTCYTKPAPIKRSPFKTHFKCTKFVRTKVPVPQLLMETS